MVHLSLETAISTIKPLSIFVAAMVVYAIFIFKFYRFVATRDIFELNLQQYSSRSSWAWLQKLLSVILYILEYLIFFPILVAIWSGVFSLLLIFLSKQDVSLVLLVAIAIVSSIRVTSYYNEDLAKDLAKMLPFALLGVFLIDISFFTFETIPATLLSIPSYYNVILYYLIFTILVEFVLRVVTFIFGLQNDVE
ncbi:hypothetical protein HN681_02125 [archaeon]|jgi:hypothetical protein|nr:hypothetical protein [archaeon]MBT3731373.1 hypothetical protein [archaeon]MBT4670324.1 hypothetical protein [archaeon]MBT5029658.1 hypothetical protein [archaeon]MBT5287593.1 hypothetical protein [archaeon]